MRLIVHLMGAALAAVLVAPGAGAEDFPSRPVTIVVPFAPGGGTDVLARLLGQKLEQRFGQPFVIENKPGAGTNIGANAVAKSAPDGYTLLMATVAPLAINPTLYKSLPFDPAADFVSLAPVARSPFVLVVNPALPVHSVAELIAYAKAHPGALAFGSAGTGTPHHLFGEMLKSMAGITMTHVPYRGSIPAVADVVAGHTQLMFCDVGSAEGMMQAGRLRALAVSIRSRLPAHPDVAPLAEAGVPGFDAAAWFMMVAPAKTPRAVVAALHDALAEALASAEVKDPIVRISMIPMAPMSVEEMQDFVTAEIARWREVVRQAGVAGSE